MQLARQVLPVRLARRVLLDQRDLPAPRVCKVSKAYKELLVPLARPVQLAQMVMMVQLVQPVLQALLALLVLTQL